LRRHSVAQKDLKSLVGQVLGGGQSFLDFLEGYFGLRCPCKLAIVPHTISH
jgi:hypothetical protein